MRRRRAGEGCMLPASAAAGIHQGEYMPYSHRSRRSHEESQRANRAGERVWMEELEGRMLLDGVADAPTLDLSVVNHLVGTVPALYRLDLQAGERYLILDERSW